MGTKQARIYNGKIAFSVSGAGKTGQLCVQKKKKENKKVKNKGADQ